MELVGEQKNNGKKLDERHEKLICCDCPLGSARPCEQVFKIM